MIRIDHCSSIAPVIAYSSTPSHDYRKRSTRRRHGGGCMHRIVRHLIAGASAAIVFPALCFAQFGAIAGVVKDSTGSAVPGVTVEAASPALIEKARTAVSDASGLYRVEDLRPGTYTVTFTKTGFSAVRYEGIDISEGFTAPANSTLTVGTVQQTITVSEQAPVVDVQNVNEQKTLVREELDALPRPG